MGKSSKDKRDIYYRLAKEEGYRARSAYKLIQVDEEHHILKAVDLQSMAPIPGVVQIRGDITQMATAESIISSLNGHMADVVVCDGAPDVTGLHDLDEYVQSQLLLAALKITTAVLTHGGIFMAKIFRGKTVKDLLRQQLRCFFREVCIVKPASSRDSSTESFIVCKGFSPPIGYHPRLLDPFLGHGSSLTLDGDKDKALCVVIPYVAQGDFGPCDAEQGQFGNHIP